MCYVEGTRLGGKIGIERAKGIRRKKCDGCSVENLNADSLS